MLLIFSIWRKIQKILLQFLDENGCYQKYWCRWFYMKKYTGNQIHHWNWCLETIKEQYKDIQWFSKQFQQIFHYGGKLRENNVIIHLNTLIQLCSDEHLRWFKYSRFQIVFCLYRFSNSLPIPQSLVSSSIRLRFARRMFVVARRLLWGKCIDGGQNYGKI
mgnify:CR=1 FL=1